MTTLANKGQKNFKRGMEHEAAQQWERAAEEFALALAAEPSNVEYQLHYRRAVFNASQALTQQGRVLYERGDYVGAYNAFRRAHGYDPENQLAFSMMDRMLQLQLEKDGASGKNGVNGGTGTGNGNNTLEGNGGGASGRIAPTSYEPMPRTTEQSVEEQKPAPLSSRSETQRIINYSGDLEAFIRYLCKQLRINAVFDRDFPKREIQVDLEDVTAAQALDYIFLSQGLFYQKLSRRTILIADQVKRPQYQQLVLKTFYLSNIDPNEARNVIQSSVPPQAGRQPIITPNKATNSLTVRDTPENIRLIGDILRSIDKDRAEVVLDVNIFEVSRTDLMQLGNQVGSETSLGNLGGIQKGFSILAGSREVVTRGAGAIAAPTALGAALIIPATTLSALQRKDQTRLIASTQLHAFDGEKSSAHIGQRVPVQTASVTPFGSVGTGDGATPQTGVTTGLFGGNGYPVIQYEKTGLTLEFTPQIFQNLDVQVKMSIKSNDVSNQGGATLTPSFTERNIEGTARIQNNRTMMIASVAQNQQSRGRQGLPILGLVPIFGRLFTAPRRNDHQTDIVIAVTPHVLRAPAVTPRDEEMRPAGTLQTPTSDTLEAMLQEVEREEQFIAARRLPTRTVVQLPDAETPTFVPAPRALMNEQTTSGATSDNTVAGEGASNTNTSNITAAPALNTQPRDPVVITRDVVNAAFSNSTRTPYTEVAVESLNGMNARSPQPASLSPSHEANAGSMRPAPRSAAELRLIPEQQQMSTGEKRMLRLVLKTDAPLGLVAATLRFDPRVLAIRSVTPGNLFSGSSSSPVITPSLTSDGVMLISIAAPTGTTSLTGAGVLVNVEVEALAAGASAVSFDEDDVHLIASDGRDVTVRVLPCQISVR